MKIVSLYCSMILSIHIVAISEKKDSKRERERRSCKLHMLALCVCVCVCDTSEQLERL